MLLAVVVATPCGYALMAFGIMPVVAGEYYSLIATDGGIWLTNEAPPLRMLFGVAPGFEVVTDLPANAGFPMPRIDPPVFALPYSTIHQQSNEPLSRGRRDSTVRRFMQDPLTTGDNSCPLQDSKAPRRIHA